MSWLMTGAATVEAWQETLTQAERSCTEFQARMDVVMARVGLKAGSAFHASRMMDELFERARNDLRTHAIEFGAAGVSDYLSEDEIKALFQGNQRTRDLQQYWNALVGAYGTGRPQATAYHKAAQSLWKNLSFGEDMRVVAGSVVVTMYSSFDDKLGGLKCLSFNARERWRDVHRALRVVAAWAGREALRRDIDHVNDAIGSCYNTVASRDKHTATGELTAIVFKERLEFRLSFEVAAVLNEFIAIHREVPVVVLPETKQVRILAELPFNNA